MLFKVRNKSATGGKGTGEPQNVYSVRVDKVERKEPQEWVTYFLFCDDGKWNWDQAYKFEPVE